MKRAGWEEAWLFPNRTLLTKANGRPGLAHGCLTPALYYTQSVFHECTFCSECNTRKSCFPENFDIFV